VDLFIEKRPTQNRQMSMENNFRCGDEATALLTSELDKKFFSLLQRKLRSRNKTSGDVGVRSRKINEQFQFRSPKIELNEAYETHESKPTRVASEYFNHPVHASDVQNSHPLSCTKTALEPHRLQLPARRNS
jgi:hypothetical protein